MSRYEDVNGVPSLNATDLLCSIMREMPLRDCMGPDINHVRAKWTVHLIHGAHCVHITVHLISELRNRARSTPFDFQKCEEVLVNDGEVSYRAFVDNKIDNLLVLLMSSC